MGGGDEIIMMWYRWGIIHRMWWGWGKVYGLGAVYFTMSLSSTDTQAHATPVTYARRAIN